jgi:hypothetical protein
MSETRGTLYNWDEMTVAEIVYPDSSMKGPHIRQEKPMPEELKNARLFDEQTGEEVESVVAYDSARGVLDRVPIAEDGMGRMNAQHDNPIIATEFRRLRIEPAAVAACAT